MMSRIGLIKPDFVLLGCPSAITGGPEAIHQLAQIINDLGVRAEILYGGPDFKIKKGKLMYEPAVNDPVREEYARYFPITARSVTLTERTLIIMPEMNAFMHEMFAPAGFACWWLSWDNIFDPRNRLSDPALLSKFLAQSDILHLAQTFRVHTHLRDRGARRILDLVDYTDPRFTTAKPVHPNRTFTVAYNPRKAGELAKHFFDRHPDIPSCPIIGMSKDQVRDALSRAMIYVEFGHNPGNDRMPREAACVGCVVLAKAEGGSAYFEDMPLDGFKFSEQDVTSGRLAALIKAIARDPVPYFEAQSFYRHHLYLEKEQMTLQVRRLLSGS
jgi:hypothetical protein